VSGNLQCDLDIDWNIILKMGFKKIEYNDPGWIQLV
jgi:hypothetical protein